MAKKQMQFTVDIVVELDEEMTTRDAMDAIHFYLDLFDLDSIEADISTIKIVSATQKGLVL